MTQLGFPSSLVGQIGAPKSFTAVNITGYGVASSIANSARDGGRSV